VQSLLQLIPNCGWPVRNLLFHLCRPKVGKHCLYINGSTQARNQRGGNRAISPRKFSQTYVFVRYSNKLHYSPPENISWLRPWSYLWVTIPKKTIWHFSGQYTLLLLFGYVAI